MRNESSAVPVHWFMQDPEIPKTHPPELTSDDSVEAVAGLVDRAYDNLRALAHSYWEGQPTDATLQPTAVVHEAVLKLLARDRSRREQGKAPGTPLDVEHVLATLAGAMRQVLVDQFRRRHAAKRHGVTRVDLPGIAVPDSGLPPLDVLELNTALEELASIDPRAARVIELRFFAGFSVDQVAKALSVSKTTAEGEWRCARAWLKKRLRHFDRCSPGN